MSASVAVQTPFGLAAHWTLFGPLAAQGAVVQGVGGPPDPVSAVPVSEAPVSATLASATLASAVLASTAGSQRRITVSDPTFGHEAPPSEIAAVMVTVSVPAAVHANVVDVPVVAESEPKPPVEVQVSVTSELW